LNRFIWRQAQGIPGHHYRADNGLWAAPADDGSRHLVGNMPADGIAQELRWVA
jgi:hypothetical protein